ncbi:MAG: hypothetical protein CBC13_08250 [Planctomycetia bacterium TMED53]|nr:MAG: hypothetical protein CBC13_08250 [Planctomycetia bacterium TMED53]
MSFEEIAGLLAAACWATGSFLFSRIDAPATAINLAKNLFAGTLLVLSLPFVGKGLAAWQGASSTDYIFLILSGVVGILVGDSAYFRSIQILGPRRALVLTTLTPPVSALIGWFWLAEVLEVGQILGMTVTLVGVFAVIRDQRLASDRGKFREGKMLDGILLGVLAALCQASGIALSKVVMQSSLGALEVSAVRIGTAVIAGLIFAAGIGQLKAWTAPIKDWKIAPKLIVASFIGTYMGIWLSHISVDAISLAVATTQMATTPVFMVLIVAIALRQKMALLALGGVLLAVAGVALLMMPTAATHMLHQLLGW